MNIKRRQNNISRSDESIDVYVCNNEARRAATGVLEDAINVLLNGKRRCSRAMKNRDKIVFRLQHRFILFDGFLKK